MPAAPWQPIARVTSGAASCCITSLAHPPRPVLGGGAEFWLPVAHGDQVTSELRAWEHRAYVPRRPHITRIQMTGPSLAWEPREDFVADCGQRQMVSHRKRWTTKKTRANKPVFSCAFGENRYCQKTLLVSSTVVVFLLFDFSDVPSARSRSLSRRPFADLKSK